MPRVRRRVMMQNRQEEDAVDDSDLEDITGINNAPVVAGKRRRGQKHKTVTEPAGAARRERDGGRGRKTVSSTRGHRVSATVTTAFDDVLVVDSSSNDEAYKENKEHNIDLGTHPVQMNESLLNESHVVHDIDNDRDEEVVVPLAGFNPALTFSDSDSDDLYSVNFNENKTSVAEATDKAMKASQLQRLEQKRIEQQREQRSTGSARRIAPKLKEHSMYITDSDLCIIGNDDSRDASLQSPPSSPDVKSVILSARKMVKMTKKTRLLFERAEKIGKSEELNFDHSFNKTCDADDLIVISEADLNPTINMKVRHGLQFTKIPIKKYDKFGPVYLQLAEEHGVRFDNVVLSLRDNILSHDQTPNDVQLSIVDIVECGIIRQSAAIGDDDSSSATDDITDNNTIQLKFQCSTRRGVLLINVNKYDKLATALQEYSRKKKIPLQNLRFMFDGEKLDPSETAITLDLEGGECIDVYPV